MKKHIIILLSLLAFLTFENVWGQPPIPPLDWRIIDFHTDLLIDPDNCYSNPATVMCGFLTPLLSPGKRIFTLTVKKSGHLVICINGEVVVDQQVTITAGNIIRLELDFPLGNEEYCMTCVLDDISNTRFIEGCVVTVNKTLPSEQCSSAYSCYLSNTGETLSPKTSPVSINTENLRNLLTPYPNPVSSGQVLYIPYEVAAEIENIQIFNTAGQVIHIIQQQNETTGTQTLSYEIPNDLESGIYFYVLKTSTGDEVVQRFFITKN